MSGPTPQSLTDHQHANALIHARIRRLCLEQLDELEDLSSSSVDLESRASTLYNLTSAFDQVGRYLNMDAPTEGDRV